jgi:PAS domain S-box-containing protein
LPELIRAIDFQSLFQHAEDGMLIVDTSFRLIEVNDAFVRLIGIERESLLGIVPSDLIAESDILLLPPQRERLKSDGSTITLRRLKHADGTLIPVEVRATLMPDGTMFGVVRDMRHRPLVNSLRTAESRLRAVTESLNVALVVTDTANVALYVNERMATLTGYTVDELVGRDFVDLVDSDAERALQPARLQDRMRGVADKYEIEHRRKDGSTFLGSISASPMLDGLGNVIGTVAVVDDVTEKRRQERELVEREQRYRSLFEVTPLPTWVLDVETLRFCTVNPAAIAHYGYSEREFLAMSLTDICTPAEAHKLNVHFDGAATTQHVLRAEHRTKDGSIIAVDLVGDDFMLDGRRARIIVCNDVTEALRLGERQRSVEEQLLLAQKMEAVGGLAGGVAHDFNNLLCVMLGASESIEGELPLDSPLREDVKDIRDAAERGAALTRQLLSLGRREVRAPVLLDLNEVVTSVSRLLFRALGPHVRTDVQCGPGPLTILADAGQLEQVLVNLAINARDAMPSGGTLIISTRASALSSVESALAGVQDGAYVVLELKDDGIGMDAATRARAFEPFFTTKGPQMGTGLGLATVYAIVQQSAGGITLESAEGAGTCVTLYLPQAHGAASPRAIDMAAAEHAVPKRRGRVLLVEDEPRVRAQARRLLERSGFVVTDAHDGAEGLFQFHARPGSVDVVVSDVMMPAMGGVEMVAHIRALASDVPVIFVSGYTADDRELPLDARTLFVPKPYSIDTLCTAIDSLIVG